MSKIEKNRYNPDYMSPPGETIQETLEMLGLTQAELAERTGRPKKTINEIIQGKAAITPETAMQLEMVLRVPASFWLAREAKYRAWIARQAEDARLDRDATFLSDVPVKEMVDRGWIDKGSDKRTQAKEVLSYFGVVSSDKIPRVEEAAFRHSDAYATNPWALAAWLRKGELQAQYAEYKPFEREKFLHALHQIRKLTTAEPNVFVPELTKLCAAVGVTVTFVKELPKTSVSGATRWISHDRPVIQLSLRHKTDDIVWFAFFHEAGHIYHGHAKREVLLEDHFVRSLDPREDEANRFAIDILIPPKDLERFVKQNKFSQDAISQFAHKLGIAPGIVVGRLQYEDKLEPNQGRSLKRTFSWDNWPLMDKKD